MTTADDKRLQDQMNTANNAGAVCAVPCVLNPEQYSCLLLKGHDGKHADGVHQWPPAADDTPPDTRSEVEALARVICAHSHAADPKRLEGYCPLSLEEAEWLLTSPWLAQHDAQVAAKTKAEVVQYLVKSIERRREQHAPTALQDVVYRTVLRIVRGESPNEPQA